MVRSLSLRQETWVQSLGWEDPLEEEWRPTLVFLPGNSHGQWTWQVCGVAKNWTWLSNFHMLQFSSVQSLSRIRLSATPWNVARQASLSITNSRSLLKPSPSSRWCHPTISSSVVPFSSCPQSLPASGSFPMSQLFASGGQSIGVSASASVLPMNTQDWSLGWTSWISLQSKGLSRVFSNNTVQNHQFFSAQLSFVGLPNCLMYFD